MEPPQIFDTPALSLAGKLTTHFDECAGPATPSVGWAKGRWGALRIGRCRGVRESKNFLEKFPLSGICFAQAKRKANS